MKIGYIQSMRTDSTKGGGYVHVTQMAKELLNRGHLLYSNLPDESDDFIKIDFSNNRRRADEIDVFYIRIHGSNWNDELTKYRLLNVQAPCIWEINAPLEEMRKRGITEKKLNKLNKRRRELAQMVNAAICVSQEMEEYAKKYLGFKKTYFIPNGSNIERFCPGYHEDELFDSSKFNVIWCGSAEYSWSGLSIVEQVADKLDKYNEEIQLIIAEDGESTKTIKYIGKISYMNIPRYLASADAGLCIYKDIDFYDKFFFSPLKLFDYMASGLPVIGSNLGQIKNVITENSNGLLTDTSVEDIIEKILVLKMNKSLARKMGENGRQVAVRYYNWKRVAEETEKVLESVIIDEREAYSLHKFKKIFKRNYIIDILKMLRHIVLNNLFIYL
ncbi:MAG: glycosyltransferase [Candidatus Marinimicrobia bacterium]|nr:glycosyltransferase [Candidatus Neomarinimicrobiota bacterium]